MSTHPHRAREIFAGALKLPAAERDAYLSQTCGGDVELCRDVRELLDAHQEASGFLVQPASDLAAIVAEASIAEGPGDIVGPYRLVEEIGEGGMGLVFAAEQEQPVRRKVALKLIKPGLDTRQVIARFEAERQALALMDHPHVARVLDAGSTASGRPYFVMELIQGVPVTQYCDQCELTTRERLGLFLQVCQGVQHAHQKGIIHRDVKPSNVLVQMQDGRPAAKVIDFGVAKALHQRLTENALTTGFAQVLGTPLYMSPEQAELSPLAVDTRTDIYSLGVLLYEFLTGTTPFEPGQLGEASFEEVRRVIREVEPPTPSARISTLGERARAIAERRRTDVRRHGHEVRGDLDWIAMRCLEKDRNRRYETASALAADVERHLRDEPVEACPPSRAYRLRKLLRRHRGSIAVAAGLIVALTVLAGSIGWMARERTSRRIALEREVTGAVEEAESWYRRERLPDAIAAVKRAEGLLASGGPELAISERVRQWRSDLETATRLEAIRAEEVTEKDGGFQWGGADAAYGEVFRHHGLDLEAMESSAMAERIRSAAIREHLVAGLDGWVLARTLAELPGRENLLDVARRADADPWRRRFREAFERRDKEALVDLAKDPGVLAQLPSSIQLLARALRELAETPAAIDVLRRAQAERPDDFWLNFALGHTLGDSDPVQALGFCRAALALRPGSLGAHTQLGNALLAQGLIDPAIAAYRNAIALHPEEGRLHLNLGAALVKKGQLDEAILAARRGVELLPGEAFSHYNLGRTLSRQGKLDEAIASYRRAIELNPQHFESHLNLGDVLSGQGKLHEAIAEWRQALGIRPDHRIARLTIAVALEQTGDLDGAILEVQRVIELQPGEAEAHYNLGVLRFRQRHLDEAIAAYRKAIEIEPTMARAHVNLGNVFRVQGKLDDAVAAFRRAAELSPRMIEPHLNLGGVLGDQGKLEEGIDAYRQALALDPSSFAGHQDLGIALGRQGRLDEAIAELRAAIAFDPNQAKPHDNLGTALMARSQVEEAIAEYRRAAELEPDRAEHHCALASALRGNGQLAEALLATRRCHELGSRDPRWPHPSADWIADCEKLLELDGKLSRVLAGDEEPGAALERLALADLCQQTRRFALAARFFEEALAADPTLAADAARGHRYNAACAAALAGAGAGRDASSLDGEARARRRAQAREWLRADLTQLVARLERDPAARPAIARMLRHWLVDPDLKGLRDDGDVAGLPPEERQACVDLWREVQELLHRPGKEQP